MKTKTYSKDKRLSLDKIYNSYHNLDKKIWKKQILHIQEDKAYRHEILGFKTRKAGKALYIIAGIHGEEPAGPIAISKNIGFLNDLAKKIPIIMIPLANPKGYRKNWRYPNLKNFPKNNEYCSVSDSEYYIPDQNNPKKPRNKNVCMEAKAITSFIVDNIRKYPPVLSLDFHEDDSKTGAYIFSQGKLGSNDPIAKEIVKILKQMGFKFFKSTRDRFDKPIINGILSDIHDGSIDELLASPIIIVNNKQKKGPNSKSVIVIETASREIPLKKRIIAHEKILKLSLKFYKKAKTIN